MKTNIVGTTPEKRLPEVGEAFAWNGKICIRIKDSDGLFLLRKAPNVFYGLALDDASLVCLYHTYVNMSDFMLLEPVGGALQFQPKTN